MNLLPKPLCTEVYQYTSDKSINDFKRDVQQFIVESKTITGKFYFEDEFYLYPSYLTARQSIFSYRESSGALLSGKISSENNITIISITIKPSKGMQLVFLFDTIYIVVIFILLLTNQKHLTTDLWYSISIPIIILHIYLIKTWLKAKVIKSLSLSPKG